MDVAELQGRLLFAVPKKGRLNEQVMKLLEGADIQFRRSNRLDIALSTNLPIALIFLNASDIAKFVGEGNVDIGITGQDMCVENGVVVEELLPLGFGKCALQVQVPIASGIKSVDELIGKRIVTSFDNVVARYFAAREQQLSHDEACAQLTASANNRTQSLKTGINYVNGSVEAACALGLADGIVDLVESGETMRAAKLMPIATLLSSEAVLICNPKKHNTHPLIETIKRRIQGVIAAQRFVLVTYNVQRANLSAVLKITPGKRAATVSPLEDGNWAAVSSLIPSKMVADIMDQLTEVGAEDILVMSLHNCRVD
ncbi:ATP phosphoribosyltransferase (ATP-PRTase) (ATP-PRT) [Kappamyces sp. JEL0829]|nr:ATP phosphoribosyltransferase (ATP-PRTase) (ATP-PRT) [Kappamyces sp. JEL0829]